MNKIIPIATTTAYHSYPDDGAKHPGLVLIEEVWGVNGNIRGIADRFAREGFNVLAPELLPKGTLEKLTPQMQIDLFDPEKRHEVQPSLREAMQPIMQPEYAEEALATLKQCVDRLLADPRANGNVGVVGFCFGGTYAFHLAAKDSRVKAAVPFYGQAPAESEIPGIACPVLALYGEHDAALMQSLPALKENMKKYNKIFEAVVYPNVGHAFFNDTNSRAYNRAAANDAWKLALALLNTIK